MPMENCLVQSMEPLKIGVVAMQGNFKEHINMMNKIPNVHAIEIRKASDLEDLNGIIIPGGESTAMSKLLKTNGLFDPISEWAGKDNPTWGTCAGLIMLSKEITSISSLEQSHIPILEICVERNHFGPQVASFIAPLILINEKSSLLGDEGVFIRAPSITKILNKDKVQILAHCTHNQEELIVAVQQSNILGTTFHPELTSSAKWHEYFIRMIMHNLHSKIKVK